MFNKVKKDNLNPENLAIAAKQRKMNDIMLTIETMLADKEVTVGEWNMIVKTLDTRQNAYLVNAKIQKPAVAQTLEPPVTPTDPINKK